MKLVYSFDKAFEKVFKTTAIALVIITPTTIAIMAHAADESFISGIRLILPAFVAQDTNMQFPEQIAGTAQQLVITPDANGAAQFVTTGEPLRSFTASIVESSIIMTAGSGDTSALQITVDNFTFGGSVDASGAGTLSQDGVLGNIRVGARANIEANDQSGNYVGVATFRIVYA